MFRSHFVLGDVEIGLELFERGRPRGNAVLGDRHMGGPDDGVQHELAEVVIAPVPVEVGSGDAETAAAVRPLAGPGHRLRLAVGHRPARTYLLPLCVPSARSSEERRQIGQDRRDVVRAAQKPHVVVPLVIRRERLHAPGDFMLGSCL